MLRLVVRTPSRTWEARLQLPPSATVGDVAQRVCELHEARPPPLDQRIIYNGRWLADYSETLSSALGVVSRPPAERVKRGAWVAGAAFIGATRARCQQCTCLALRSG